MSERDDAAAAFYEIPENRKLRGPGRKRRQTGQKRASSPQEKP